jgi:cytoskeletal protein CcmA (bactofilin family)
VNGEIHADNVQVYGRVKGLIKAKTVQLHSTCCVEGIIMHEAISIEDGAIIDGKIKRTNKASSSSGAMPLEEEYEEYGEYSDPGVGSGGGNSDPHKMMENIRLLAG